MVFTWSENPYRDMWNHLRFLAKKNNARNLLAGKIPSARSVAYEKEAILERKASQVSFGISQAYEYFRAAESVTIATSPLLYFYGMLSLAKSLIVANQREVYLENVKYHGLKTRPIDNALKTYSSNPELRNMEDEYAVTTEGVFKHLTKIICDFEYPKNAVFTFKNIIAVCPELSTMYEKYYGEPSKVLYLYSFKKLSEDPYKIQICPSHADEQEMYKRVPQLARDFDLEPDLLHGKARVFTSRNLDTFPDYMGLYYPVVGGKYVVGGLTYRIGSDYHSRYIEPPVTDYIAMYILSMCVRYKQDFWGSVIQGERSGVLGLIELYISVVRRRFPNLILNHLFGQEFGYGAPARLM